MADERRNIRNKLEEPAETRSARAGTGRGLLRRDPYWTDEPFSAMRRLADQMDRWFNSSFGRPLSRGWGRSESLGAWMPQVETFQRGDEFVVRADLPGLKKEDVTVELTDDALTIQGERRNGHEEEREGYFSSERSYGSFYRVVPLPDGAITDSAKASFTNGVLEVVVKAPPNEVSRGRRIEITESAETRRT